MFIFIHQKSLLHTKTPFNQANTISQTIIYERIYLILFAHIHSRYSWSYQNVHIRQKDEYQMALTTIQDITA